MSSKRVVVSAELLASRLFPGTLVKITGAEFRNASRAGETRVEGDETVELTIEADCLDKLDSSVEYVRLTYERSPVYGDLYTTFKE